MEENNKNNEPLNKDFKVPKLRFKSIPANYKSDFISTIFKCVGGGTPSTKNTAFWEGSIPWVGSSSLFENNVNDLLISKHISNVALENSSSKLLAPFSILVVTRVGVGKVAVNKVPLCTSQDFCNLYAKNINSYYFAYLIQHLLIKKISQGSTIQGISSKEIKKIQLNYPSLEEQNKIASFLNIIESKIKILESKINILKKYKEGLIDKLLISKGNDYIFLKDLIKIMPKGNLGAKMGIINGSYPFYLSGDNTSRLNSFMLNGTYIIANDGGEAGFRLTKGKFSYSDHCICFKGDNDIVTVNLFNYLNSIKRQITYKGFTGSGLKNIDRQYFFKLKIPQKIRDIQLAKVFQLVQTYIDNLDQEVKLAHLLKTNILNNMFI